MQVSPESRAWGRASASLCLAGLIASSLACSGRDTGSIDFEPRGNPAGEDCEGEDCPVEDCDGCAECTTDSDCTGANGRCSQDTQSCVECISSSDCAERDDASMCARNGSCVECLSDADCTEGEQSWCLSGTCAECRSNADCADGDEAICSLSLGECVECERDADCTDS